MEIKGVKLEIQDKKGETSLGLIEERCKRKSEENRFWYDQYKKVVLSPDMILKMKNHSGSHGGATPLHIPIEWDDLDLTRILVQAKGIKLNIKSSNSNAETALDLVEERCFEKNSQWYEFYKELLAYPDYIDELKNRKRGVDKDTPLHRAIKGNDINLTKTLLVTKEVELDIEDKNGNTALDLLEELYNLEKWGAMCRELRLDPSIKIFKFKYFQRRTSLVQMQETLSVVAALLATITFAAGIAVPGGVDGTDGAAILGKSAAFLVFTIANTLAMCSSIVVLFTVIGAMIWEAHPKATSLIDLCVFLLQLSLGGTSVAFMTGVYAIMSPKIKWAAYVVIGLSSLAFILALTVVSFFWPLLYKPFSYFRQAVCRLVSHLKRWVCCGDLATDNGSPDAPSQQSGNLNTQQVMGLVPDSSTVIPLPSNEAESFANANTMLINGASDGPTPAALPSNEPPLSANTIMPTAGPEHSQQELQKTNEEAGESSESKATGSECKIDIGEGEPQLLFASNK